MREGARVLDQHPATGPDEGADHHAQPGDTARHRHDRIDRHVDAVQTQLDADLFAQRQIAGRIAIAAQAIAARRDTPHLQ